MTKPKRLGRPERSCHDCQYVHTRWYGDRTTIYLCRKKPGLCVGEMSQLDTWFAKACEEFKKER